ncbi:MAG TPA: hypothetical protein IGS31_13005 [Oscillatoriales cyanobacterium M4454_W2019_049]|nr:hypothetical protein [Oscillatoriales cyanobacterium M4454_W2019_049]
MGSSSSFSRSGHFGGNRFDSSHSATANGRFFGNLRGICGGTRIGIVIPADRADIAQLTRQLRSILGWAANVIEQEEPLGTRVAIGLLATASDVREWRNARVYSECH